MKSKKGLVGFIILLILLVIFIALISSTALPLFQKTKETAVSQYYSIQGITEEDRYAVTPISATKGYMQFFVTDKETGQIVTDFSPYGAFEGYSVTEDGGLPVTISNVISYPRLNVAIVADPALKTKCGEILNSIRALGFDNTYVMFPGSELIKLDSSVTSCTDTGGDYWTAIKETTYSLPAQSGNYNAILLVTDGLCSQNCDSIANAQLIEEATQGLLRNDLDPYIFTTNGNCEKTNALRTTATIVGETNCINIADAGSVLGNLIKKLRVITIQYEPKKTFGYHNITVKVTKKPYMGRSDAWKVDYGV
jgi:hypothetical protein